MMLDREDAVETPPRPSALFTPSSAFQSLPIDLSIVIPVYNEAHRIRETVKTVHNWLVGRREAGRLTRAEIIVVSDGSNDHPSAGLRLGERDGITTRYFELPENRGKGAAVRTGVLEARGALVLFSDADLATPIEEAARLEDAIAAGADVAIASRRVADSDVQVEQTLSRRLTGGLFPRVVRLLTGLRHADTQCGFKMFRREAVQALFVDMREERFAFDVELLCAARENGLSVAEVGVVWRDSGETTVRLLRDPFRMGTTLLRLADPQRFPRVFARQLGLAAVMTLALLAFARGAFNGPVPLFESGPVAAVESAAHMVESGAWLVPTERIAGVTTPLLGHAPLADWAIAISRSVFGANDFATRFPSYLSGLLLLALVFRAARCFGQRDLAALAALVLGSSFLFLALWGTEITDLTATLTLAGVWLSAVIARGPETAHPRLWRLATATFFGLALLSIGPLALPIALLPFLVARPFVRSSESLAVERAPRLWWLGALSLVLAIALPWYLAVEARHPGAWRAFFVSSAIDPSDRVTIGAVWLAWAGGLLPWPILLLFSGKRGVRGLIEVLQTVPAVRALLVAATSPPIVATFIRPTDATWVLPALPPAAIVLALGIRAGLTGAVEFRMRLALFASAPALALFLVLGIALARPALFDPLVGLSTAVAATLAIAVVATRTARRVA